MGSLLKIDHLGVDFHVSGSTVHAVSAASLNVEKGETVALVGESGSGKSVTALSVMQLLPYPRASHPFGSICFEGEELLGAEPCTQSSLWNENCPGLSNIGTALSSSTPIIV